jgi:hypothetical protein
MLRESWDFFSGIIGVGGSFHHKTACFCEGAKWKVKKHRFLPKGPTNCQGDKGGWLVASSWWQGRDGFPTSHHLPLATQNTMLRQSIISNSRAFAGGIFGRAGRFKRGERKEAEGRGGRFGNHELNESTAGNKAVFIARSARDRSRDFAPWDF